MCFGDDIRDRQLERSTCTRANTCVERKAHDFAP